jgi:hypothetical protein
MQVPASTESEQIAKLRSQYGCGPVEFAGTANALYERHLVFDDVIDVAAAGPRERFAALARSVRDILSQRWIRTEDIFQAFSHGDFAGRWRKLSRPNHSRRWSIRTIRPA